jgi:hypothetical protein
LFSSAQWEWGHLENPQLCLALLPFPAPAICAVTLALSELQRKYFFAANILLPPTFCQYLDVKDEHIMKDCVLCIS